MRIALVSAVFLMSGCGGEFDVKENSAKGGAEEASDGTAIERAGLDFAAPNKCKNGASYFTYGQPLNDGAPRLADLFADKAEWAAEPEVVAVKGYVGSAYYAHGLRAQMLPVMNGGATTYYTVLRLFSHRTKLYNQFLFKSTDGKKLEFVPSKHTDSDRALFPRGAQANSIGATANLYDAHVSYDPCTKVYTMVAECTGASIGLQSAGGVCQSQTTNIADPDSWSAVKVIYRPSDTLNNATGFPTTVRGSIPGELMYMMAGRESVAVPEDAKEVTRVDPKFRSSKAMQGIATPVTYESMQYLLDALPLKSSTSLDRQLSFANNQVVTDVIREDESSNTYYLSVTVANYFDAVLPKAGGSSPFQPWAELESPDKGKIRANNWALTFAKSETGPLGPYKSLSLTNASWKIDAPTRNTAIAGISTGMVNAVGGELYLYYATDEMVNGQWVALLKRQKLVRKEPKKAPAVVATTSCNPSDLSALKAANGVGEAKVALTGPAPYRVFQRGEDGFGCVRIRGSVASGATGLEVRLLEQPTGKVAAAWQTLATWGGAKQGVFDTWARLPQGGWYTLQVRSVCGDVCRGPVSTLKNVGIGEVFVTAGQSNSANYASVLDMTQTGLVSAFDGKGWRLNADPQPLADGLLGSVWPAFGDRLVKALSVPVGVVAIGVGATSVKMWQPGAPRLTSHPCKCVPYDRLSLAVRTLGKNGFRAVLWHQGEADAGNLATATSAYAADLSTIIARSRADAGFDVSWVVAQATWVGTPGYDAGQARIRAAQTSVVSPATRVFAGPDTDVLKGAAFRALVPGTTVRIHLNGRGQDEAARLWVDAVTKMLEAGKP